MSPHLSVIEATPQPDLVDRGSGYFVTGDGPPVVLLHASLSSKSQWLPLAERLSARFRVIGIDLHGYGDNSMPDRHGPFTLDSEVALVDAMLDPLISPHARVHVVGHSYGGLVALRYAHRARERVASLTLYEPVAFRLLDDDDAAFGDVQRLAFRLSRLVAARCDRYAAQTFVDFWSGEGTYVRMSRRAQADLARRVSKLPLDFAAASSWPRRADVREIVGPTLLLGGRRSPAVVQRVHARLVESIPHCRAALFDAGHMGPIGEADRINQWIEAFVDRCKATTRAVASPFDSSSIVQSSP
jgi:pimeloyl-ACP methyl ester carboxylesterase